MRVTAGVDTASIVRVNLTRLLSWLPENRREAALASARQLRARAIHAMRSYTPVELEAALRAIGVADGDSLVVHAAFRPLNGFIGDPVHVIDCLLDIIGPQGNLMMLSMPYSDSARAYLESRPVFDVRRTPSQMGVLSECFRRRRGVVRSANPLHPVLAWGPRAEWLVDGHDALAHSCGRGSPFEKMLDLGTKALFFDVGIETLTFAHYLEEVFRESAPVPVYAPEPMEMSIVDARGELKRFAGFPFASEALKARNFTVLYDALIARGLVGQKRVGNTRLRLTQLHDVLEVASQLHRHGQHVYASPGAPARVIPTPPSSWTRAARRFSEEIRTARALRRLIRIARGRLSMAPHQFARQRLRDEAWREVQVDGLALLGGDAGAARTAEAAVRWLCEAQDHSSSGEGGVARDFTLGRGWSTSFPETTGIAAATLLRYASRSADDRREQRARRMLDWLVEIQDAGGGFRGGTVQDPTTEPVAFSTGHILLGLAAGAAHCGDARYVQAMHRAARWLVDSQDAGGCWRAFPSPTACPGAKSYDTLIAWALFETARVAPGLGYEQAAVRNVDWALTHQRSNGWFGRCSPDDSAEPLTLTIGYALRGVMEAFQFTGDVRYLEAATRTADVLARTIAPDGFLAGRLRSDWTSSVSWSCIAGTSLLAHTLLLLHAATGTARYLDAARRATAYVRRTVTIVGPFGMCGGVKGSFPVYGDYCALQFPNWAATLTIDANLAELAIDQPDERARSVA